MIRNSVYRNHKDPASMPSIFNREVQMMFNGKMKAVTFSYDDGVTQDKRLIELFNKYGLKGTFNLNSELMGRGNRIPAQEIRKTYAGHEIAVHTLTHPTLTHCDEKEIIRQVAQDRANLSELAGYEVVGMAYPGGGVNYNHDVAEIIRRNTTIQYARTTVCSVNCDLQSNLLEFLPSTKHTDFYELFTVAHEFLALRPTEPKLFYIWGHSYELDFEDNWDRFENFCRLIANREDIFYGTNRAVFGI